MKYQASFESALICLLALTIFGCQNQSASNLLSPLNSNVPASNANSTNRTISETGVTEPQNIKFESEGQVEIIGTFYESPKANSPAVILLHQWGSNRQSYDEMAKLLQLKGFGVLAIDGRGFGDSIKTTNGQTVGTDRGDEAVKGMKADVANAFNFLAKQKNVDAARIGIVGASYGSSLAMIYGAENKQVKAVALLSPGLNYFGNLPIESAVKNYGDRPLLMVAADDDQISAETVKKLKDADTGNKYEVKIYPKGGHGTGLFGAKVRLEELLEHFLRQNLS